MEQLVEDAHKIWENAEIETMTSYPHRIRLRGPWEVHVTEGPPRRALLPAVRDAVGIEGPVTLRRAFGFPGRIDDDERVWLIGAGLSSRAEVSLNDAVLGIVENGRFAFEVTSRLRDRNVASLRLDAGTGGVWDDVALEIRATAYLDRVAWRAVSEGMEVTGRVVGACDTPLDLYLLRANATTAYQTIRASESGTEFRLMVDEASGPLRVELVSGATIWYVVERES